jgi:hypothetical protein
VFTAALYTPQSDTARNRNHNRALSPCLFFIVINYIKKKRGNYGCFEYKQRQSSRHPAKTINELCGRHGFARLQTSSFAG